MASDASSLGHAPPPADASSSTIHGVIQSDAHPRPPSNIEPPTVTPVDQINPDARSILEDSISTMFGIDTPRDLQLEVINHCAWDDNAVVFVNAKTAVGKSLCPLTIAAMHLIHRFGHGVYETDDVGFELGCTIYRSGYIVY